MKHIIYLTTLFVFLFSLAACKKSFLDVPVTKEVVAEDYVNSLSRSEEFLNGIFLILARDIMGYKNVFYADVAADNGKVVGSYMLSYYSWKQVAEQNSTNNMNDLWLNAYNGIRSCNFLLERVDQFRTENPLKADVIKGQALALRALFHHNLVMVFAQPMKYTSDGSHLGIHYDTVYSQNVKVVRQPVADVYQHIIADYKRALDLIPNSLVDIMPSGVTVQTWISKNATKALLSRAYLFMGKYDEAKEFAKQVANMVPLMPNSVYPASLFTSTDKESLFWSPPANSSVGTPTYFQGYLLSLGNYVVGSKDLVSLILERPNDRRNNWFKLETSGKYLISKYPKGVVPGVSIAGNAYYETIIRSSEMFLTCAECFAKLGKEDSAIIFLDQIRKRADLTAEPTTATGNALLDSIYKERRKELCFENLRLYDLLRVGKGVNRSDITGSGPKDLPYPSNFSVSPIPITDANTYRLEQNPGYN